MHITPILLELSMVPIIALLCLCFYIACWILAYFTSWLSTFAILLFTYWYMYRYTTPSTEEVKQRKELFVVIVGAGFSGICTAIQLKRERIRFVVLEKSSHIGGTWWDNKYPGCNCDVPSHFYNFSFHTNPFWSEAQSNQPEMLEYIENICEYFNLYPNIKLDTQVDKCEFDVNKKQWKIFTSNGEEIKCNFLVSGIGSLHVPKIPEITGQDRFLGESFHTTLWKEDCCKDKTVGIIGTGASAVHIIPTIASRVKHLYVFQRTPAWVVPRLDFPYPRIVQNVFHILPFVLRLYRWYLFTKHEMLYHIAFTRGSIGGKVMRKVLEQYHIQELNDPTLHSKMIPDYELGWKRITFSNKYLATFNRLNVTLVDQPIAMVTETGIAIKDKDDPISLDTIVYATGFDLINNHLTIHRPEDNKTLAEIWGNAPNAYNGIMCPGFPNFFILLGPNTLLGHSSVVWMMECQVNFIVQAITKTINKGYTSIEVTEEANNKYQSFVKEKMKDRVFGHGVNSWYRNSDGHNFTLWPKDCISYWWQTMKVNFNDFVTK